MSQTLADYVATRLRIEMARSDVAPPELARRLDEQSLWVVRRMRGRVPITLMDLERIATALDVPVAEFLPAAERVA